MPRFLLPLAVLVGTATGLAAPSILFTPRTVLVSAQRAENFSDRMTQQKLEDILREIANDVESNRNQVLFSYNDRPLLLLTDTAADRMRVMAPITQLDDVDDDAMTKMMIANFHTALDGRYAVSNGIVYATFIHPLSSLAERDFRSAVDQVANLAQTYGSTYTSGTQLFGAPAPASDTVDSLPAI
ncbi:MAG: hypothetical protein AAGB01_03700 [Cyanobacteria bacterium P01_F01_bin.42]